MVLRELEIARVTAILVCFGAAVYLTVGYRAFSEAVNPSTVEKTPSPTSKRSEIEYSVKDITSANLFGWDNGDALTKAPQPTSLSIELLGVFQAVEKQDSRAVLLIDGQQNLVAEGEEVAPGVSISQITRNFVDVLNDGRRERVVFNKPTSKISVTDWLGDETFEFEAPKVSEK